MSQLREWYYAEDGNRHGPLSREELDALAEGGTILSETPVWHPTYSDWQPYGGGTERAQAARTTVCRVSGDRVPAEDAIALFGGVVSAPWKEYYLEHLREGLPLPGEKNYAGFWPRAAAKLLDYALLGAFNMCAALLLWGLTPADAGPGVNLTLSLTVNLLQIIAAATYATYFIGAFGATPGKMALGLSVVAPGHERVSYLRAFGRYWAEVLSGMVLYLGYLMPLFDDERRALHDHLCGTRVLQDAEPPT